METKRPYWKVGVSLAISLIGTLLFLYLGGRLLIFFMPFVIGWIIAMIANPLVKWLEKRLKIVRKLGSAIIIILVLGIIVTLIYLGISRLVSETMIFIENFPEMYAEMEKSLIKGGESLQIILDKLPVGIQTGWNSLVTNLDKMMGDVIGKISEPTVVAAGNLAKRLPAIIIAVIITVISAYFFIADREEIISWTKKVAPKGLQRRMTMVINSLKSAVGGYFKAQFKIMLVVGVILLVGFWILNIKFAVLLAILIAFLDFLPFFGTGTALIPWAIYHFLAGNYRLGISLVILYAVTQVLRQVIQPKLVADSMGLNPLLTLVLLYVGYKVGSVLGMIVSVPIGMIVINMYDAGAFDYILNDVKILIKGVSSLRKDSK